MAKWQNHRHHFLLETPRKRKQHRELLTIQPMTIASPPENGSIECWDFKISRVGVILPARCRWQNRSKFISRIALCKPAENQNSDVDILVQSKYHKMIHIGNSNAYPARWKAMYGFLDDRRKQVECVRHEVNMWGKRRYESDLAHFCITSSSVTSQLSFC